MCTPTSVAGAVITLAAAALLLLGGAAVEPANAARAAAAGSACGSLAHVYYLPDGQDFRGTVHVTEGGIPCQLRSSQTPNSHEVPLDSATGVGNHNYCRDAGGLGRPGCFAATPVGAYQLCAVRAVCTARSLAAPTVQFWPVSGTKRAADGSSSYLAISCHPRPCSIHYVLGAEAIASARSPVYTQPLLLEQSTTVKTYVRYETAEPMRAQARYTVTPAATSTPAASIQFIPSDAVVYSHPIFVELQGITNASEVLLFWADDFMNPTTYTGGAFRVERSTSVVAVVNSTYLVSASYKLDITAPPLNVYPPSGTYVGGVTVLVSDPQPPATYYMYVNQSTDWQSLGTLLFPWTAIGTSELDIRALHVEGIESAEKVVYEVVPATPPTILPDASIAHHRPANVTCTAPLGTPVALSVYRDAVMQDAVAEGVFSAVLSEPGAYTVSCTYADDLHATHTTMAILQLVAVPMQPPTFTPACGTSFPAIALSLQMQLNVSNLLPGDLATSWSISASAGGGARIPMITRCADDDGVFEYDVLQSKSIQEPTTMEVYSTARSLNPLEADSPRTSCTYSLYPLGASATPYFSAIPDCATTSALASPSCIMALKLQLASCLHFYSTELLSIDALGPIVAMRMTGLAAAIQTDMYTRIGECLTGLQHRGVLSDVRNETSGEIMLATSWHVATPTRMAAQVYTGLPITVQVSGFHTDAGAYHLVRSDYSCEDIGVLPEAVLETPPYHPTAAGSSRVSPSTDGSTYLTFRVPIAGQYKLCSYISNALYEVPFSFSTGGAAAPAVNQYLDVVVQPWPTVDAVPAEECGGLVPPDKEDVAFSLSMAAVPAGAYASLAYSFNSAGWGSVPFAIDAATQLGGAASLSIGPLNRYTRPLEVLDASLGPTTGAAQTCIFFVSAANSSVQRDEITYLFYKMNSSEVPADLTGVMLLLQGQFQPAEMIVIDVYENVTLNPTTAKKSSSLQLLRRVTARPSAATAFAAALPDAILGLPAGAQHIPYVIHVTLDGVHLTAAPSTVALSPLALAMEASTACPSGLALKGQCLCRNKRTKVISACGTAIEDSGSSDAGEPQSRSSADSSSCSTTDSSDDTDTKTVSLGQRLAFLFAYLGLLAAIAGYILISIKRGGERRRQTQCAEDVAVENSRYPRMGVDSPQGTAAYFWLRLRPSSWGPDVRKTFSRIAAQRPLTFTAPMPLAPRSSTGTQRKAAWGGEASVHGYVDSSVTAKPNRRLHKGPGAVSSPFLIMCDRFDTEENRADTPVPLCADRGQPMNTEESPECRQDGLTLAAPTEPADEQADLDVDPDLKLAPVRKAVAHHLAQIGKGVLKEDMMQPARHATIETVRRHLGYSQQPTLEAVRARDGTLAFLHGLTG
ncbi:Kringle domain family protein [Leishmania donovani]|uniref:Kringle domain family protein n=2 Tax=Leishmania donovani TaxID=5661 RepID=A0A504X6J1_LEIDO|nr:Kringle domain family protein [Leishmania donovani]